MYMDRSRSGGVGPSGKQQGMNHFISTNAGGFTSLIELPPTQAVELLYFTDSSSFSQAEADSLDIYAPPHHSYGTLTFPFNSHLSLRRSSKTETSPMRLLLRVFISMINMLEQETGKDDIEAGVSERIFYMHFEKMHHQKMRRGLSLSGCHTDQTLEYAPRNKPIEHSVRYISYLLRQKVNNTNEELILGVRVLLEYECYAQQLGIEFTSETYWHSTGGVDDAVKLFDEVSN
ncbi:hypothetical protein Bca52824_054264 [Brassica carinata]|uniref:Uncharacterized protein n=1 Tax=Brassica carinata TaxID=52824 RepID=A0A8X7RD70_BRACI|nr:hypothetical protein Bca52824_054264 [Brassica carinata]